MARRFLSRVAVADAQAAEAVLRVLGVQRDDVAHVLGLHHLHRELGLAAALGLVAVGLAPLGPAAAHAAVAVAAVVAGVAAGAAVAVVVVGVRLNGALGVVSNPEAHCGVTEGSGLA